MPRSILKQSAWAVSGIVLLIIFGLLSSISHRFVYGSDMAARPILLLVGLLMLAAVVYLALWIGVLRHTYSEFGGYHILWIIVIGLGMRLLLFPSLPMLEDDYHRYLWDGGVAAKGYNPYRYIPADVEAGKAHVPEALAALGEDSGLILDRVNHAHLGTVYPPVTEAVFAIAHWIQPWSRVALKSIYLLFDGAVLLLLVLLLQRMNLPAAWTALYWWNPLFIKETYNSLHMDILVLPFLVGALLLFVLGKHARAVSMLAAAVAAKLWPVLIAPLLLWPLRRSPARMIGLAILFGLLCCVLLAPILTALQYGEESGFIAYGQRWEMNDALYMLFPWLAEQILVRFGGDPGEAVLHAIGRGISVGIVLCVVAWAAFRRDTEARALAGSALAIAATLFLVSPTQFPWYFTWMLPMLALRPRFSLLLLTLMLPLYYLKFYFDARNNVAFFHYRIVWIEYAPVWIAIAIEGIRSVGGREEPNN